MTTIETGGPAFPRDYAHDGHNGMTLRDYFATHCGVLGDECSTSLAMPLAATQGIEKPSDNKDVMGWHRFWCAVHAAHNYMMADAMLAARKAGAQQ